MNKIIISRNVKFDENKNIKSFDTPNIVPDKNLPHLGDTNHITIEEIDVHHHDDPNNDVDKESNKDKNDESQEASSQRKDRSLRSNLGPYWQPAQTSRQDKQVNLAYAFAAACIIMEPQSFNEACCSPETTPWKKAMDEEYKSLLENNMWELVKRPKNRKVISSRWIYQVKLDNDGNISRYKA